MAVKRTIVDVLREHSGLNKIGNIHAATPELIGGAISDIVDVRFANILLNSTTTPQLKPEPD